VWASWQPGASPDEGALPSAIGELMWSQFRTRESGGAIVSGHPDLLAECLECREGSGRAGAQRQAAL